MKIDILSRLIGIAVFTVGLEYLFRTKFTVALSLMSLGAFISILPFFLRQKNG